MADAVLPFIFNHEGAIGFKKNLAPPAVTKCSGTQLTTV